MITRFFLSTSVLMLLGCQSVTTTQPTCDFNILNSTTPSADDYLVPDVPGSVTALPLDSVNVTDPEIVRKILPAAVNGTRLQNGLLEVGVRLQNCTTFDQIVEARTIFLNAGKTPSEDSTAWQRLFLSSKTMSFYKENSTNTMATSFVIEVRETLGAN